MAQQVFTQWAPVAKAQNEQGQEVYLPFAGIHAQTRDGKDEIIVGAGNMVWTGSMWVPVSNQNRLPVEATLSGRSVKYFATLLTNTPLAARGEAGSIYTSSVRDLTADGAHLGYGLTIFSDTFCVVRMSVWNPAGNYLQEHNTLWFGVWPNLLTWLPPFRPPLTRWIWRVDNLANVPQTQLAVHEVATDYLPYSPANLRAILCYNLAIRDTNLHWYTTDPNNMVQFRRTLIGGAKSPVLINNQLNQAVRAQIYLTTINIGSGKVYEVDVPAGSTVYITNQEAPALDVPYEEIHVRLQCTTAPTSGTVSVAVDSLVGGTA